MSRHNQRFARLALSCIAIIQLFSPTLCATTTQEILLLDREVFLYCCTVKQLQSTTPVARHGEDQQQLTQVYKNSTDQGRMCAEALTLLQEVYKVSPDSDDYDSTSIPKHRVHVCLLEHAQALRKLLAKCITDFDSTARLRFYTTYFALTTNCQYSLNQNEWKQNVSQTHPYLFTENATLTKIGLEALVEALNNDERSVKIEAIDAFKQCFSLLAQQDELEDEEVE